MHPFEVMAEPVRRRIVEILAAGEHPSMLVVEVIRHEFSVTSAAVSHHLRVLRETGWVDVRHEENKRFYVLAEDGIQVLRCEVKRLRKLWKNRLGWGLPGDTATAGIHKYEPRPPSIESRRGLRGKLPDGFTRATHKRRDALRGGA
ncbi:MAG TPA: metalloregulator ArsR/SmtB family transcription factor [Microbacterium sp.]|nr:metalloregulator ArsR/SmtB family transcription factor [Microbacterium sp.]